uniref:Basic phospholipase A2 BbTX-III n=1 Tax=Bothrops brazili TaxID=157546 RepID=PA2B3_BOTBZ|nr:RecName: Full=Basic phospholipase A2 BbTX-III; Short=svPLA2; AltName: Full=Brazilitoxin III; Short=BbTX-III; AltName: Full=Phosphatidylcholine 2-acylhydrolase [Bothrops brazili]
SLWEWGQMILKETGKNPFPYYGAYGCYCGWGGRRKPKDATDRCCFVHDCCRYKKLTGCPKTNDRYSYSRLDYTIVCGEDDPCKEICECDKAAAVCFRENLRTYNKKYMAHLRVLCKKDKPC